MTRIHTLFRRTIGAPTSVVKQPIMIMLQHRQFATKKPDWMVQAEIEAIAATNARAAKAGTANDHMMSKIQHELDGEKISNSIRLQDKLKDVIDKCHKARAGAVDTRGRMVYNTIRKKALQLRQDLITQKEAAGMMTDATSTVEAAFPIPGSV